MKKILLTLTLLVLFMNISGQDTDIHRFGITIEGGYSGFNKKNEPSEDYYPQTFLGNFGGTIFYQFTFYKYVSLRPEIGLYSYFFKLPMMYYADYSSYNVVYSSLNGRIGVSVLIYLYRNKNIALHFGLAPLISMRFYDSAGLYLKKTSSDYYENPDSSKKSSRNFYFSGGVSFSLGLESAGSKPVGTGGAIFLRFIDRPDNSSEKIILIPSIGGSLSLFW